MNKDTMETLRKDIMYLAEKQKIIEDAVIAIEGALLEWNKSIGEWTEFMTTELLRQGTVILKDKRGLNYFKHSLKDKFKADYEKFESLFLKINTYFDKSKAKRHKYKEYK